MATQQGKKRPVRFIMQDKDYFGLPAIYDEPNPDFGPPVRTFTIFTTEANRLVAQYPGRIPAILWPEQEEGARSEPLRTHLLTDVWTDWLPFQSDCRNSIAPSPEIFPPPLGYEHHRIWAVPWGRGSALGKS
jgi:putative SOS response-associated peptidase YedK